MARATKTESAAKAVPSVVMEPPQPREIVQDLRRHVTGKELAVRLAERIRWHRERGDVLIQQMKKLGEVEREAADELAKALSGYESPRDHLASGETYRLDSTDLRMTEILPEKPW